jgi:hypothetical protein
VAEKTHIDVAREDIGGEQLLGHVRQISPNARDGEHRRTLSRIFPPPREAISAHCAIFTPACAANFAFYRAPTRYLVHIVDVDVLVIRMVRALFGVQVRIHRIYIHVRVPHMFPYVLSNIPICNM